jgi:hypothetical protein
MLDTTFDLFARHQWETEGGRVFDEDAAIARAEDSPEILDAVVAQTEPGCPTLKDDPHTTNSGLIMAEQSMNEILVHKFHPDAECEYSGRTGEAVEISTSDGSIQHAVVCFKELTKLLRFRHRQGAKQKQTGSAR